MKVRVAKNPLDEKGYLEVEAEGPLEELFFDEVLFRNDADRVALVRVRAVAGNWTYYCWAGRNPVDLKG